VVKEGASSSWSCRFTALFCSLPPLRDRALPTALRMKALYWKVRGTVTMLVLPK
jgi:hypothetical protein